MVGNPQKNSTQKTLYKCGFLFNNYGYGSNGTICNTILRLDCFNKYNHYYIVIIKDHTAHPFVLIWL